MSSRYKRLKIFTGNANAELAEEIAQYLGVPVGDAKSSRFCDGESYAEELILMGEAVPAYEEPPDLEMVAID